MCVCVGGCLNIYIYIYIFVYYIAAGMCVTPSECSKSLRKLSIDIQLYFVEMLPKKQVQQCWSLKLNMKVQDRRLTKFGR
jgi:hypothetical protein